MPVVEHKVVTMAMRRRWPCWSEMTPNRTDARTEATEATTSSRENEASDRPIRSMAIRD